MTAKVQVISVALLLGVLLLAGCSSHGGSESSRVDEFGKTPLERKKAELLKQLDRKFENPDVHFELGQLYHSDGMWAEAEYRYNTALSFDPAHRNSQAAMVKVLADSGDNAKAQLSADIYMNQVCASAEQSLLLAMAFQQQGLDERALACYRQALRLAPNSAKIHRQIGYYYLSRNDNVLAKEYLSRSFQINPNQPEVAGELGRLGVAIRIPRKTEKDTKRLDKIVEQSDKQIKP